MSTEQPAVLTERRDNVLVITLNRPEARNAVNLALAEGIAAGVVVILAALIVSETRHRLSTDRKLH